MSHKRANPKVLGRKKKINIIKFAEKRTAEHQSILADKAEDLDFSP